jgi:D-glycero-alpha-D-manno-heptose 1-phosphate guanylyltransferase
MVNEAIILAGGFGTRLQKVVNDVPKPMAPVRERPFLEYILDFLGEFGITRVILSTGYKYEIILNHFGNKYKEIQIDYSVEKSPLGTGGAIKLASEKIYGENTLILNGDSIYKFDLAEFGTFFQTHSTYAIALRNVEDASRYGKVEVNSDNRIISFAEKSKKPEPGLINSGIYLFNMTKFRSIQFPVKFSIEQDFFQQYTQNLEIYGYKSKGYFIDIGIPEDYYRAQIELV